MLASVKESDCKDQCYLFNILFKEVSSQLLFFFHILNFGWIIVNL